jgi:magnesium-protoporphyrin IX monomethyl ester (oxidative) cyclase
MYEATMSPPVKEVNEATKAATDDAVLNPRFYTTDFDEMDRLDISPLRKDWDELVAEFRRDPNKTHFKRTPEFENLDWTGWPPELQKAFIEFLVSSVTAEFSGCILYAEIKKRVKNKDIRDLFGFMSRDEGRHAGFINHVLADFNVAVDLSFLTKAKKYTYFKPKYIYYATYLSEKIGYARYITIFRQLEKHPEFRFHPIFKWFEEWCNDEFRHGEAFAVLMRANPQFLQGGNKLWIRFFLLAVFATMYVRDHARLTFFHALGFDVDDFDRKVITLTNTIAKQCFPVTVDVDNPKLWALFERMHQNMQKIEAAQAQGGIVGSIKSGLAKLDNGVTFLRLFMLPAKHAELPVNFRLEPVW